MTTQQPKWTGELDLTVFHNGRKSVARDIFLKSPKGHASHLPQWVYDSDLLHR